MKVYRYLCETELNKILNNQPQFLGNTFKQEEHFKVNTFNYKPNEKYIHFYKNKSDIERIRKRQAMAMAKGKIPKLKYYICSFEIPKVVLFFAAGKGFYSTSGFDQDYDVATEYAILAKNFNCKWLKNHILDNQNLAFKQLDLEKL